MARIIARSKARRKSQRTELPKTAPLMRYLIMAFALALAIGCSEFKDNEGNRCNFAGCTQTGGDRTPTSGEVVALNCTATPAQSRVQLTDGEATTAVQVRILGGTGSYSIDPSNLLDGGYSGISSTGGLSTIMPLWTSLGSKSNTVFIRDLGTEESVSCDFSVQVVTTLDFACDIIVDTDSPVVNGDIDFNFHVSGPNGRYYFKFYPNAGESKFYQLTKSLTNDVHEASHTYQYDSAGTKIPQLKVKNLDTQEQVQCSLGSTIQVREPAVTLSATPSSTVPVGSTLRVQAMVSDFEGTPSYTFSADSSHIQIQQSGSFADLTSDSPIYVSSNITVVATDTDGQVVQSSINVVFAPTTGCSVSQVNAGSVLMNQEVQFQVSASNGGTIVLTEFEAGDGGTISSGVANPVRVLYSTSGNKVFRVKAEVTSGNRAICNSGAWLEFPIEVLAPLGCTVTASPNSSHTTSPVMVQIAAQGTGSSSNIEVTQFGSDPQAGMELVSNNGLNKTVEFYYPGVWPIRAHITDTTNQRTATCETQHQSTVYAPACSAHFRQDGQPITQARKEDRIQMYVDTNIAWGGISITPGAPVLASPSPASVYFPVLANNIVYNHVGPVTAQANITNYQTNVVSSCPAPLTLTAEASCTMSGPTTVEIVRTAHRGNTHSDVGPASVPYTVHFASVKYPVTADILNGSGQSTGNQTINSPSINALVPFKYSGTYTPSVSHTDKFDSHPDSCNPGPVHVNKVTNTYVTGAYSHHVTVQVCNYTAQSQTIWIFSNGHPGSYDFHNIPAHGGCRHYNFEKRHNTAYNGHNAFYTKFKTLYTHNPNTTGLVGRVCRGYNNVSCGYTFSDL